MNNIYANITAVGKYLPKSTIKNDYFEQNLDTSNDWIISRTGIKERRQVAKGEASVSMGTKAIQDLLNTTSIKAKDIDAIMIL